MGCNNFNDTKLKIKYFNAKVIIPQKCPGGYYCFEQTIVPLPCSKVRHQVCCKIINEQGNYCPEGFWKEFSCIPGTFADQETMPACKSCPRGSYCPLQGQINPVKCQTGYVSEQGATSCSKCPDGHKCANGIDSGVCPAGGFCDKNGRYASCPGNCFYFQNIMR